MNILYMNNYKGFISEYLPFQDINFFVGDNSTGKSSIISLINSMQNREFWNNLINLNFREFLNQNTNDDFFRIGICFENSSIKNINAICIKYTNKADIFQIEEMKFIYQDTTYFACKKDGKLLFDLVKSKTVINSVEDFKQWIDFENFNLKLSELVFDKKTNIGLIISSLVGIEIHIPDLFSNFISKPPIRTEPKEIYSNSEDTFTSLEIMLDHSKTELIEFGKKSGLFDNIKFEWLSGKTEYLIKIEYKKVSLTVINVGYGISQILPLLLDMINLNKHSFAFQQPEIHLHPKAQAEFGEIVYNAVFQRHNKFIIETHSDYMIDRFRFCLHYNDLNNNLQSQIVFFKKNEIGNNEIKIVPILENGNYEDCAELDEFRDFFIKEQMSLLEM